MQRGTILKGMCGGVEVFEGRMDSTEKREIW